MEKSSEAHSNSPSQDGPRQAAARRQRTRRRILRAGALGVPVVITVCSRPARADEDNTSAYGGVSPGPPPSVIAPAPPIE